jgi:hypothetical protein
MLIRSSYEQEIITFPLPPEFKLIIIKTYLKDRKHERHDLAGSRCCMQCFRTSREQRLFQANRVRPRAGCERFGGVASVAGFF